MLMLTLGFMVVLGCIVVALCAKQVEKEQLVDLVITNTDVSIIKATEKTIKIVNLPD